MKGRAWGTGYGDLGLQAPDPIPQTPFRYSEHQPSEQNARLVLNYWSFQADRALAPDETYTVFPDGCASVACVRAPAGPWMLVLVGPRATSFNPVVVAGSRIWGVRFWPDAIAPALTLNAREIRNHYGLLPAQCRAAIKTLAGSLPGTDDTDVVFPALDAWAASALGDAPDADPRVRAGITAIAAARGECSMADVARSARVGLRHLQRLFPDATGLTLREFARVRRLREALALRLAPEAPAWSRIAAGAGFVDHAHLTREFLALAGVPPTAAARQMKRTAHHGVRP